MQYPEFTSVTVVQAWPEPGSLKSCGEHHLEPQGSRAYSSAVPRVISLPTFSKVQASRAALQALHLRLHCLGIATRRSGCSLLIRTILRGIKPRPV